MSATPSPAWTSAADPGFDAMVLRGVALIGVLKGFTRGVFGLGRAARGMIVRLTNEGAEPYSANSGFDFPTVVSLLRRALHLADALRARLLTPPVALALVRRRSVPKSRPTERPAEDEDYMPDDPVWLISYLRADEKTRSRYRQAIADMSDSEVVQQIYTDLASASAMLGQTEAAAQVAVLAHKAAGLLEPVTDEIGPANEAPPPPDDRQMADAGSVLPEAPCATPPLRAVGRGPP